MFGLFWGTKNSDLFLPALLERVTERPTHCVAWPANFLSENLKKEFADKDYRADFRAYGDSEALQKLIREDCEILVFTSRELETFKIHDKLVQLHNNRDFDFGKISPDFLGLKFDRLNEFFIPLAYWVDELPAAKKRYKVTILLAAVLNTSGDLNSTKELLADLISAPVQKTLSTESKIGSVLRDTEVDAPIKASAIRKLDLNQIEVVDSRDQGQ